MAALLWHMPTYLFLLLLGAHVWMATNLTKTSIEREHGFGNGGIYEQSQWLSMWRD